VHAAINLGIVAYGDESLEGNILENVTRRGGRKGKGTEREKKRSSSRNSRALESALLLGET